MAEDNNDKYDSFDKAFETADENLDDIQKSIDKLDDELLRLNADLIHRKGSKKRALKQQIKNVEQALKRKQRQYKSAGRNVRATTKVAKGGGGGKGTMDQVLRGVESVAGIVGGVTGVSQIGQKIGDMIPEKRSSDMPDQQLDEVTVTAPKKDDFLYKYKYYLIGAGALILLFLFKKK